jgi:glycosyltransferase involved in cell wall biosynthesis
MRILYSHRTKAADGQFVHIRSLTRALHELGHEVLLCGPEGTWPAGENDVRALTAEPGAAPSLPPIAHELAERGYSILGYQRLLSAARRFGPDVIYERYNLHYHAGTRVAVRFGCPLLLEVNAPLAEERATHGRLALRHYAQRSERTIWRRADRVLPVTAVLADVIERTGVQPDRIAVIPNGVDDHYLEPADGSRVRTAYGLEQRLVLGFVGFVRDWHRLDLVLDWMAKPQGRNAALLIVGDGPAVPRLRQTATERGIEERVVVTGVVQRPDVARHIAAFDIALQPASTAYASPLKLQEYMAQGRAIIAPDQPNIREVVTHGVTAHLVTPDDPQSTSAALDALSADRTFRDELGAAAKATIVERDLTWRGNARRVAAIAEALLAAKTLSPH